MDDYERHPKQPGWLYEYFDGVIQPRPAMRSITALLNVSPRPTSSPCAMVPADAISEEDLVRLFIESFSGSVEFLGWEGAQVEAHARRWIAEFFKGKRGWPLALSRIAVAEGAAVGAALFRDNDDIPFLDLLYIHPDWQRQGLATALVAQAVNTLHRAKVPLLTSRYDLANTASQHWHRRFGFVDCAGWMASKHLRAHWRQELRRRELIGDLSEAERQGLALEIAHWDGLLREVWGQDY